MVIIGPTNMVTITNPASINLHASVTPSSTNIATVAFLLNGTNIAATADSLGSTNYSATVTSPAFGTYLLTGVVSDSNSPPLMGIAPSIVFRIEDTNNTVMARDDAYVIAANGPAVNLNILTNDLPTNGLRIDSIQQFRHDLGVVTISHDRTYLTYTPLPNVIGTEEFVYGVTNATGGGDSALVMVTIAASPSVYISSPDDGTSIPTNTSITISALSSDSSATVTNITLYANGVTCAQTNAASLSLTWSTNVANFYTFVAVATDNNGLTNMSSSVTVAVTNGATATNAITASIQNLPLTDNGPLGTTYPIVRDGLFHLQGDADDSNAGDAVSYQVLVCATDGYDTVLANVTPKLWDANGFHSGRATNDLGIVDFTTLANSIYDLVLIVHGGGGQASVTNRFSLDTPLKIGQFSFSEQDMVIPANGIPITIVRTYNSLNNISGDFGYDWTFALNSMDIALDEQRTPVVAGDPQFPYAGNNNSSGNPSQALSIRTGGDRDVTLTLPDGRRTTFVFKPLSGSLEYTAQWVAPPDVHATLEMTASSETINLVPSVAWQDGRGNTTYDTYDVPGWVLTTQDGTVYNITRGQPISVSYDPDEDGGNIDIEAYGPPQLTSIVQRTGDILNISSSGITHTNIHGGAAQSTFFQRDSFGHIAAIYDPTTGTNGLPLLRYIHDQNNGNLLQVWKLQDRNAGTYTTNKYHYDNPNFPHYLTSMENPLGVPVARNEYDDQGRLIAVVDAGGNTTQFFNSTSNQLQMVIDPLGNTNSYVYDSRGNVTVKTNALNQVTLMSYDDNNNKLSDVNVALGATNYYGYDANNYLTATTNALGFTNLMVYDVHGLVLSNVDARGYMTTNNYDATSGSLLVTANAYSTNTFTYDGNNRLLLSIDALGNTTSNSYDANGNLTNVTVYDVNNTQMSSVGYAYDDNGNRTNQTAMRTYFNYGDPLSPEPVYETTAYFYDAQNRLVETIDPLGHSNSVIYNAIGKRQATIDQLGRTNTYTYDDKGNLTMTTYPDGTTEASVYDANSQRIASINRSGITNQYVYDPLGRLLKTIAPDNTTNSTVYDSAGRAQYTIDARGTTNAFGYDILSRQTSVTNACGTSAQMVMSYTYDQDGNQLTVTDGLGHSTTNVYDQLGRVATNLFQDGTMQITLYDPLGRKVAAVDQATNTTQFGYDGLGRLISVTNALNQVTAYGYDEAGNLTVQADALGRTNGFAYDALGRKIYHMRPDNYFQQYDYDAAGNLSDFYDFANVSTHYEYDAMNRVTNRWYTYDLTGGLVTNQFTYTPTGQRASMTDPSGTYTYVYDLRDRLCTNITPQGTLYYQYDANGNLTNMTSSTSGGTLVSYQYDALNRLTNVIDGRLSGASNTSLGYEAAGDLQRMQYPNGMTNLYQYDPLNRLTNLTWKLGTTTNASFYYQLGPTGNRTNLQEYVNGANRTNRWSYDPVFKLTLETVNTNSTLKSIGYTFDEVGNRLARSVTNFADVAAMTNQTFVYDTNDWLTSDTYDNSGNTSASASTNYAYDAENRLTNLTWTGHSVTIVYNGDGQRVGKTVDGTTTLYLVDTHNLTGYAQVLEELQPSGGGTNLMRAYTYGLSLISQRLIGGGGSTNFFGFDGHGSVRFLTSTNGAVTDTFTYDAYGTLINITGSVTPNNYLYSGEQWDYDVGLYFLRARYMNPNTGRFWTRDSFDGTQEDPLSLHRYLYCEDTPLNGLDPTGFDFQDMMNGQFVHREIAKDFIGENLLRTADRWISTILQLEYPTKYFPIIPLRPDLIDRQFHFIIEIKPILSWPSGVIRQADYLQLLNYFDPLNHWTFGTEFEYCPPSKIYLGSGTWAYCYGPDLGVITYKVIDLPALALATAAVVVTAENADTVASVAVVTLNMLLAL
jgi:RHS repeat-associated protein